MNSHPSLEAGCTQCEAILKILESANGAEVAMPYLAIKSGSMAVATRISNLNADLKAKGYEIVNRQEQKGKKRLSFYKLISL